MAYQVLARKWRPQDFSGVVGQQPIVTALRNALADERIAQAYLFSGIRGVGKTSVARILAKALNCEKGPTPDPCNECLSCREITAGDDLDVLEFDAATHSKVDQVRELTESLKYGPARDRYKVIILDEIHRLSRQAFDALLKIVEEPPPHLVFIFATTEAEAVPVTILSRCQEFRFRRVPREDLVQHLETIAKEEKIEVGPSAIRMIARAGDGSVRDSVALLDQLATFGSGKVADEDAARLLGGLSNELLHRLLGSIVDGLSSQVSKTVTEIDEEGWDPRHVYGEFLAYCRIALHLALDGDPEQVDLPREEAAELSDLAHRAGYENLLRAVHLLLESEATVRRSESGSLAVEVAWLRAAELPKLVKIEEILGGGGTAPSPAPKPARQKEPAGRSGSKTRSVAASKPPTEPRPGQQRPESRKPPEPRKPQEPKERREQGAPHGAKEPGERVDHATPSTRAAQSAPSPPEQSRERDEPLPEPEPVAASGGAEDPAGSNTDTSQANAGPDDSAGTPPPPAGSTEAFIERVSRQKSSLAAHLTEAEDLVLKDGVLTIFAPPGDTWLQHTLARDSNARLMNEALESVWGAGLRWRLAEGTGKAKVRDNGDEKKARVQAEEVEAALQDPRVQTVLDIFGGSVESVD